MAPEQHGGGEELGRFLRARRTQTIRYSAGLAPGPGVRRTHEVFPNWDNQVRGCVARLRAWPAPTPTPPDLTRLVGELLLKSPDFAHEQAHWRQAVRSTRGSGLVCQAS